MPSRHRRGSRSTPQKINKTTNGTMAAPAAVQKLKVVYDLPPRPQPSGRFMRREPTAAHSSTMVSPPAKQPATPEQLEAPVPRSHWAPAPAAPLLVSAEEWPPLQAQLQPQRRARQQPRPKPKVQKLPEPQAQPQAEAQAPAQPPLTEAQAPPPQAKPEVQAPLRAAPEAQKLPVVPLRPRQQEFRAYQLTRLFFAAKGIARVADDASTGLAPPTLPGLRPGCRPPPVALSPEGVDAVKHFMQRVRRVLHHYELQMRAVVGALLQAGAAPEALVGCLGQLESHHVAWNAVRRLRDHLAAFIHAVVLEPGLQQDCEQLAELLDTPQRPLDEALEGRGDAFCWCSPAPLPLLVHPVDVELPSQVLLCGQEMLLQLRAMGPWVDAAMEQKLQATCLLLAYKVHTQYHGGLPMWLQAQGRDPDELKDGTAAVSNEAWRAELEVMEMLEWRLPLTFGEEFGEPGCC